MISPAEKVQGVGERKREERVRACLSILPLIDSSIRVRARRHGVHTAAKSHRAKLPPPRSLGIGAFSGCWSSASKAATTTPWTALKFYCEKDASATSRSGSHEYLLRTESERVTSFIFGRDAQRIISRWDAMRSWALGTLSSSLFAIQITAQNLFAICMNKEILHIRELNIKSG